MQIHHSNIFSFDKELTFVTYQNSSLIFLNEDIKNHCLNKILESMKRNNLNIGIDFTKPWEEIEMNDYYQIEYLFVGELINITVNSIKDDNIGINVFNETRFSSKDFNSKQILNLTFIIEKE